MKEEEIKKIREDFQDFADSIIWSNDDGSEKYIAVGNMADWWLSKFDSLLAEKRRAVEACFKRYEGEDLLYYKDPKDAVLKILK